MHRADFICSLSTSKTSLYMLILRVASNLIVLPLYVYCYFYPSLCRFHPYKPYKRTAVIHQYNSGTSGPAIAAAEGDLTLSVYRAMS